MLHSIARHLMLGWDGARGIHCRCPLQNTAICPGQGHCFDGSRGYQPLCRGQLQKHYARSYRVCHLLLPNTTPLVQPEEAQQACSSQNAQDPHGHPNGPAYGDPLATAGLLRLYIVCNLFRKGIPRKTHKASSCGSCIDAAVEHCLGEE